MGYHQNSDISKCFQPDIIVTLSEVYSRRDSGIGHVIIGVYEKRKKKILPLKV